MVQSSKSNFVSSSTLGCAITAAKPVITTSYRKFGREVKRLSEKELQENKDKGLCFKCDEKWRVGHQCKKKELSIILALDEDEDEEDHEEEAEMNSTTKVCLNFVLGITKPKTMKLKGIIQNKEVVVMIDPGATHNFIALKTVERLQIPVTNTGGFGVALGTGVAVQGQGVCQGVTLQL